MGWIVAFVAVTALILLRFILSCPEAEEDWRDQAEGLRQRQERDGVPRASYEEARHVPRRRA